MATKTAILSVKIVSDAKDFSSKMDDSAGKLDKFQNAAKKLAVPAAAVLAGLGSIAVGAAKMASESEQNFGAVDAVFKDHASSVKDMAKNSASTLGLSASDYAKYSALLGSQLKNAGVPMDQLAGQTNKLIGYGADFAAQFGGTVPEAVDALSSALKGEMDPIEKYGISLNEAKIKAQMAADGTSELTGAAYDSAKAQAIMTLIQNQGADAMGAFGREAGTAAGQQAIMTAKWQDASAQLGSALLPIMTQAASVLADVAKWVSENSTVVTALAIGIGVLAAAILAVNAVMWIMAANPMVLAITAIVVVVALLVAGIIYLATQTTFFQDVWRNVTTFCRDAWSAFTGFVSTVWNSVVEFVKATARNLGDFWNTITTGIGNAWNAVVEFIKTVALGMQIVWQNIVNAITNVWVGASNFIKSVAQGVGNFFNTVFQGISNVWNATASFLRGVAQGVGSFFSGVFQGIANAWNAAVSFIRGLAANVAAFFGGVVSGIRNTWSAGFSFIQGVVGSVIGTIISIVSRIAATASSVVGSVRNAFASGFNAVVSFVGSAINTVMSIIYRIISAVSTTINSARNTFTSGFQAMQSFAMGIINNVVSGFSRISGAVSSAINWVRSLFNMGGMPGWLSKVLGRGGTGFEFTGEFAPTAGEFGMGGTGGLSFGALVSGGRTAPVVNNYSITVNGALDPNSVAKQIKGILNKDARTDGKIEVGKTVW